MPNFWKIRGLLNYALLPLGWLYFLLSGAFQLLIVTNRVNIKVICVGNIISGGGGKTPVVQALAKKYKKPAIILRGYKGRLSGPKPVQVDLTRHSPQDVGDEAILHAKIAPTYICTNRFKAAQLAESDGAKIIIMDDGLQNPTLFKDEKILVFEDEFFIGNGYPIPAGPLREPFNQAIELADKIFILSYNGKKSKAQYIKGSIFLEAKIKIPTKLKANKAIVFTAIANPDKFRKSLGSKKISISQEFIFPDHHSFTNSEIEAAITIANNIGLKILTTSKDFVKIPKKFQSSFIEIPLVITFK